MTADLDSLADPFKAKAYRLQEIIDRDGLPMRLMEARRKFTTQRDYFMKGRGDSHGITVVVDKSKVITQARPGQSPHNWGLAVDYVIDTDHAHPYWAEEALPTGAWDTGYDGKTLARPNVKLVWERYGRAVKEADLEWGGHWKFVDMPHAQLFGWDRYRPANWQEIVIRELSNGN